MGRLCSASGAAVILTLLVVLTCMPATVLAAGEVINGNWTAWSELTSTCTKTCGGGTLQRIRTCTNPVPENGGRLCNNASGALADVEIMMFNCSMQSCWSTQPEADKWGNWTDCSVICGIGNRSRQAMCDGELCTGLQEKTVYEECNTWVGQDCPDPCLKIKCPKYSLCHNYSTPQKPITECICTMGYKMQGGVCVRPPPTTPTPRPIPTLPPDQKIVATVISKTASTVLIVCVSITLAFFILMRIFTTDRVIQMNMEIALLTAHLFLLFPSSTTEVVPLCRFVSIALHFLFTAVFMFMLLEALHMYALVGFVVQKDGMFTRTQNVLIGWGVSLFIVLFTMCYEFQNYGAVYHCWLALDKGVGWAEQIPIYVMMIITFTLIEAAGAAEYKKLNGTDPDQLMSAKFSQRTNLLILPMVYVSWLLGVLSEYEQNMALYSLFSLINSILGVMVMLMHCSNNQKVRERLVALFSKFCCKKKKPDEQVPVKQP